MVCRRGEGDILEFLSNQIIALICYGNSVSFGLILRTVWKQVVVAGRRRGDGRGNERVHERGYGHRVLIVEDGWRIALQGSMVLKHPALVNLVGERDVQIVHFVECAESW